MILISLDHYWESDAPVGPYYIVQNIVENLSESPRGDAARGLVLASDYIFLFFCHTLAYSITFPPHSLGTLTLHITPDKTRFSKPSVVLTGKNTSPPPSVVLTGKNTSPPYLSLSPLSV